MPVYCPERVEWTSVSKKPLKNPAAYKNTYFWISGILFLLAIVGLVAGSDLIRDPGQTDESGLPWIYLGGAIVMLINGILSHRHTVQLFNEEKELEA